MGKSLADSAVRSVHLATSSLCNNTQGVDFRVNKMQDSGNQNEGEVMSLPIENELCVYMPSPVAEYSGYSKPTSDEDPGRQHEVKTTNERFEIACMRL